MSDKVEFIKAQVKDNKVVVYSKTHCPFCKKAKDALKAAGLKDYLLVELDERDDGDEFQDALLKITEGRSVSFKTFVLLRFYELKKYIVKI